MNKYGAKKTTLCGIKFDSQAEGRRYLQLLSDEQAGRISGLTTHPSFVVFDGRDAKGKAEVIKYLPDFTYTDEQGRKIAEDVKGGRNGKGTVTRVYQMKAKMFRCRYHDIELRIVEA